MSWLLNRAMLAIFLTLAGAGIGAIVGSFVDARQLGPIVGAAVAVAIWVMVDGVRALHLMNWLRGDLEREALAPVQCSTLIETVRGAGYRLTQQAAATSA